MEYLFIYGLQVSSIITIIAITLLGLLFGLILLMFPLVGAMAPELDELVSWWNLWIKKTLIFLIVTPLILFLLPTKQTMLLIGGTYLGKKAVNQVVTSDKMEKINTIIDLQLDKYIKELKVGNNGSNN